ncbi:unnamed protein product [Symbiodinium natans]|uniref:Uncharacterized protein n=1 Tax=Symbiodinium natans TaxID=878477 RepID=A0A812HTC5_9DINO|nr:unnamed protein product [Symbiodinium natans]
MRSGRGWRPLEAKKAPWEHRRPPKQVAVETGPSVDEAKEQQDILEAFRLGRKEMKFEVDQAAVPVELPDILQTLSFDPPASSPTLAELRNKLRLCPDDCAPPIAKVNGKVVMVGIRSYSQEQNKIKVLPVLDPTQESNELVANCEFLREGPC